MGAVAKLCHYREPIDDEDINRFLVNLLSFASDLEQLVYEDIIKTDLNELFSGHDDFITRAKVDRTTIMIRDIHKFVCRTIKDNQY